MSDGNRSTPADDILSIVAAFIGTSMELKCFIGMLAIAIDLLTFLNASELKLPSRRATQDSGTQIAFFFDNQKPGVSVISSYWDKERFIRVVNGRRETFAGEFCLPSLTSLICQFRPYPAGVAASGSS